MQPAQGVRFIHIAICREVREIESQAATAESPDELTALGARLLRFGAINKAHTDGEEAGMNADLEQRAPHVRGHGEHSAEPIAHGCQGSDAGEGDRESSNAREKRR
jgi:hypothetical protein